MVVPKIQGAGDLAFVERLLEGVERAAGHAEPLRIQAVIETAQGLRRLDELTSASSRLEAVILGYADLVASLGRSAAGGRRSRPLGRRVQIGSCSPGRAPPGLRRSTDPFAIGRPCTCPG